MKFYTYAIIMVGVIMILNLGGIDTPIGGGLAKTLNLIDEDQNIDSQNFKNSTPWDNLTYLLTGLVTAGVVLGAFGRTPDIRYMTAAIVFTLTALITADAIAIWSIIASSSSGYFSAISTGMGLIIGGLLAGLFVTALEFWQNAD
jgi:hypothetical protein